jgi:hypothetical protein
LERFIALSFVKMDAELLAKGEAQLAKNLAIPPIVWMLVPVALVRPNLAFLCMQEVAHCAALSCVRPPVLALAAVLPKVRHQRLILEILTERTRAPKTALFNSLTMDTLSLVSHQESAPDTCSERRLQCSLCFSCSAVFRNHCLVASCCVAIFHFRLSRALSTAFMLDPAAANL